MKTCFVIGAGEFSENSLAVKPGDMVIAADGGYLYLEKIGIKPDLILGDFDSAVKPDFHEIAEFNSEKDDTDTALAVDFGFSRGYTVFEIYGGTGGRFDHTFANIQTLLGIAKKGGQGYLFSKSEVAVVTASKIEFDESYRGRISVFSLGDEARGVSINGLKYSLRNACLTNDFPLGVSNEFTGEKSEISVKEGYLLIIYERQ